MTWIRRSAALGAGFGLAAAAIDLWMVLLGVIKMRSSPSLAVIAENALVLIALGVLLGLANAVTLRWRTRAAPFVHLLWLCGAWYLVERWCQTDAAAYRLTLLRPLGAGALVFAALLLERSKFARAPWVFAALAAVAGLFAPELYIAAITPDAPPRAALPQARAGAPDVVLVVLDTVRAEHMSSYGHSRDTSPGFAPLARDGAWFPDAVAPGTWSLSSHASLFTGRYPTSHGATLMRSTLDRRFPTLAEVLAAHGYETFCFTANGWINDAVGLTRGFAVQNRPWKQDRGSSFAGRLLNRIGLAQSDKGG